MQFEEWPKTARLFRDVVVTEKIDGTNAAIRIEENDQIDPYAIATVEEFLPDSEHRFNFGAQSRKRLITPEDDNYGFAAWVRDNALTLLYDLGPGIHFGEWWGQGIQRRYGLEEKRFSLFNTKKWDPVKDTFLTPNLHVVPVLYEGVFDQAELGRVLHTLELEGSVAAPGFDDPEGICVFHTQSRKVYKYTLDGDGHKG